MKRGLQILVLVMLGLSFLAPLAEAEHGDSGCESACVTHFACFCHALPSISTTNATRLPHVDPAEYLFLAMVLHQGRQSQTDIFRPPTRT